MLHTYTFETTTTPSLEDQEQKVQEKLEQAVKSGKIWSAVLPSQVQEDANHSKLEHREVLQEVILQNLYEEDYIKDSVLFSAQKQHTSVSLISCLLELSRLFREDHFQWQLTIILSDWNSSSAKELFELLELITLLKIHTHIQFTIAWAPISLNEQNNSNAIEALLQMMETIFASKYFSICNIRFRIPSFFTSHLSPQIETFFHSLSQFSNLKIQISSPVCNWKHPLFKIIQSLSQHISITSSTFTDHSIMNSLQINYSIIDCKFDTVALNGNIQFSS